MKHSIFLILLMVCLLSCKNDVLPKPSAYLRLDFPEATYTNWEKDCPFGFESNTISKVTIKDDCSLVIDYPTIKGSIYLTYKKVDGNIKNLLIDAQKLTYEHVVKADQIDPKEFINDKEKVYGMFYEVMGNAASQSQFYATDSLSHFVTGSLYFYAKPNYDSIYPAAIYLQKDIRRIMESLEWKN
ncbi:MAG: gliding motility lipoprotein GldD [Allomuricauda sp.]|nr:MAG: gliding motility lipoprotein GldD [Allomuricauda sp.]